MRFVEFSHGKYKTGSMVDMNEKGYEHILTLMPLDSNTVKNDIAVLEALKELPKEERRIEIRTKWFSLACISDMRNTVIFDFTKGDSDKAIDVVVGWFEEMLLFYQMHVD
jgi:hypothetical protein